MRTEQSHPDTDRLAAAALKAGPDAPAADPVSLRLPRPWRAPPDALELSVGYACEGSRAGPRLTATVNGALFRLDEPVALEPVTVAKPWGREIWYTGIEARGESRVVGEGGSLGLGSYLSLAPRRLTGGTPVVLLKVLDPRPEPVLGELYLEVHERKQEVYVVTAVHPDTWPDGRGRIRYGANQTLRRRLGSDAAFRRDFLAAVEHYEAVRRAVDDGATHLSEAEERARQATLGFTEERELAPGDVIRVPTWIPHSLQPGVQVVEFQTPTYERYIVSASQRVLTQAAWDSAHAIEHMDLEAPDHPAPESLAPGIDRIVDFDEFGVWRARLGAGGTLSLPEGLPYAIAYCISGSARLGGASAPLELEPGGAAFVPGQSITQPIGAAGGALLLVAGPGL